MRLKNKMVANYLKKIAEEKVEKHANLREILTKYGCEETGDCIVDEICDLFNYPRTD